VEKGRVPTGSSEFSERRLFFGKPIGQGKKVSPARIAKIRSVVMKNRLTEMDRLVKPDEVATLLALSRRTLRRYEVNGRLRPVKINQRVTRYRMEDVLDLMGVEVAR
jgi:hypothetical protein